MQKLPQKLHKRCPKDAQKLAKSRPKAAQKLSKTWSKAIQKVNQQWPENLLKKNGNGARGLGENDEQKQTEGQTMPQREFLFWAVQRQSYDSPSGMGRFVRSPVICF